MHLEIFAWSTLGVYQFCDTYRLGYHGRNKLPSFDHILQISPRPDMTYEVGWALKAYNLLTHSKHLLIEISPSNSKRECVPTITIITIITTQQQRSSSISVTGQPPDGVPAVVHVLH